MSRFKTRDGFSSQRPLLKRRSSAFDVGLTEAQTLKIENLFALPTGREQRSFFVNMDETFRGLYPYGVLSWTKTESGNVKLAITRNEKAAITVRGRITADSTP